MNKKSRLQSSYRNSRAECVESSYGGEEVAAQGEHEGGMHT